MQLAIYKMEAIKTFVQLWLRLTKLAQLTTNIMLIAPKYFPF